MKIKLSEMDTYAFDNFLGGEGSYYRAMFSYESNIIFKGFLNPSSKIGMFSRDDRNEVIIILKGNGLIREKESDSDNLSVYNVSAGDCVYIPKGQSYDVQNTSQEDSLIFYSVLCK